MDDTRRWAIRGTILSLERPLVMGILNVTPDSFFDGGRYAGVEAAVTRGRAMVEEGADIIDVGGESSRPGSAAISPEEEMKRVLPVIKELARTVSIPLSCDTCKPGVAAAAIEAGASIINDIHALRFDPAMAGIVRSGNVGIVLMHMQKDPRTMQQSPSYSDVVREVCDFLAERISFCREAGIEKDHIVLDPGIGFGKTLVHNLALLNHIGILAALGRPVLVGASRKSFIGGISGAAENERYEGSLAAAVTAYLKGAAILRVHDVIGTRRALDVASAIEREHT